MALSDLFVIFFDQMPTVLAIYDRKLQLVQGNRAFREFVARYHPTTVQKVAPGNRLFDLFPELEEPFTPLVERALTGEQVLLEAQRIQTEDVPTFWDVNFIPLKQAGSVEMILVAASSVTEREQAKEAQRESSLLFHNLFDTSNDVILFLDQDGNILDINPRAAQLTGYSLSELRGMNAIKDLVLPQDQPVIRRMIAEVRAGHKRRYEVRWRTKAGIMITFSSSTVPRFSNSGAFLHTICILRDITGQKEAEENNRRRVESLEKLEAIATQVAAQVVVDGVLKTAVAGLVREFSGYSARVYLHNQHHRAVVLRAVSGYTRIYFRPGMRQEYGTGIIGWVAQNGRTWLASDTSQDPHFIPCEGIETRSELAVPIWYGETLIGVLNLDSERRNAFDEIDVIMMEMFANNLAANIQRATLYEQVQAGHEEMRKLSQQLISAAEEERRRLSRELHDEANQSLTALKLNLTLIRDDILHPVPSLRQRMEEAVQLTDETMERMRILAQNLRPPALEEVGLSPTLEDLCRAHARSTQISIQYQADEIPPLTDEANITLYRVLQEALANISKHAGASHVQVNLRLEEETFCLIIQDNGQGFDAQEKPNHEGIGLLGMRERLELLGGHLEIDSRPGAGARLTARIPRKEALRKGSNR